jgi:hypothetical protein
MSRTSLAPVSLRLNPKEVDLLAQAVDLIGAVGVDTLARLDLQGRDPVCEGRPAQARSLALRRALHYGLPLVIEELRRLQQDQSQGTQSEE